MKDAACTGSVVSVFFPTRGEDVEPAKQICYRCPVRPACLELAISEQVHHGIWGGVSERGRRRIRRAMALSGRQWSGVQMLAWYEANQLAMDDRLDSTGGSTAPLPACEKSNLSYVRGCRCDDCREAAAQAKRAWRARTAV